jgi:hypothetical protein
VCAKACRTCLIDSNANVALTLGRPQAKPRPRPGTRSQNEKGIFDWMPQGPSRTLLVLWKPPGSAQSVQRICCQQPVAGTGRFGLLNTPDCQRNLLTLDASRASSKVNASCAVQLDTFKQSERRIVDHTIGGNAQPGPASGH